jgi:aconitate hydratase
MKYNVAQKLIESHLVSGLMKTGTEISIKIDQTLTQDATGTMVMLELEAMNLTRVKTELSAQYVDHNLVQADFKNADDHLFLRSACKRFGIWYSRPGNGVSHPLHMERFGEPGKTLLGSDSHTCGAGAMAMLAIGAGGLEVARVMAGETYYFKMPKIMGVRLIGKLPDWVSAKDVILQIWARNWAPPQLSFPPIGRSRHFWNSRAEGMRIMKSWQTMMLYMMNMMKLIYH